MDDQQGTQTSTEGQVAAAPDQGTTGAAPTVDSGQAPDQGGQSSGTTTTATPEELTFFDPSTVPPELQPAYKSMQAAFTKKMQNISGERQKIEAYNQFMADPVGNLQQMARQYGYTMTRGEAQQIVNQQQKEDWAPQTWEDVMVRAKQEVMQEVMTQFAPLMQSVQKVQASNIEAQLTKLDPNWRMYEDEMRANIQAHPSLVNDVSKLYRLSVPEEVYMGKATQAAIKKLQDKASSAQVADRGTTSRSAPAPEKANSFDEAVAIAKRTLAEKGR